MSRLLWGWLIAAGLLLARMGYMELEAAEGTSPEVTLLLLTGGLLAGLFGITGLLGMLGWMALPGRK
ncbi:hypothetical protein [Massilia sp. METH4]|uniref:hypothetical protein n=1 Tax=Massilia sp. METH4 TaxID=3123041 RepID=UPI0030CC122E